MSAAEIILGVVAISGLVACQERGGMLYAYIDMPASEFNSQDFVKARNHPLQTEGVSWIGYSGGFNLKTRLGGRYMDFPISGWNGGLQITGWQGLNGSFSEPHIDVITFVIDPQDMAYEEAFAMASGYCRDVTSAGLNIPNADGGLSRILPEAQEKATQSLNGIAVCSIRNDRESFEARIVPLDYGDLKTLFRIEVSLHTYFELPEDPEFWKPATATKSRLKPHSTS